MNDGDRVTVVVLGERVPATVKEPVSALGNVFVRLDTPIIDDDSGARIWNVYRDPSSVTPLLVDEAVGVDGAHARRWAVWHRQFDLVREADGVTYLTRWWLVKTPWGGVALHRMDAPDARETVHDHPFSFVSVVLRGGYVERRLRPEVMRVEERHVVHRVNRMRAGVDAHSIRELLAVPTWTLLFVGRNRRRWGFWQETEYMNAELPDGAMWTWTDAQAFDSGHYVPLPDGTR